MSTSGSTGAAPANGSQQARAFEPAAAMCWTLAMLSFGAGAVHLVMVPQHAQESLRMGVAFAAAGWFQIAFGAALLARPRRIWLWLAIALNSLFIATWVASRTIGLPDWTGGGGVEAAQSVDVLCVAFEIGIVIGAIALLASPQMLSRWKLPSMAIAAIISVTVLVATTLALAAPSTATHVHGSDEGTDLAAGAHEHETKAAAATDHAHDSTSTVAAGASATEVAADHHGAESTLTYAQLPKTTKAEVDEVIAMWGNKYATAGDAMRDGWIRGTRNLYGIGAHYIRSSSFTALSTFDRLNPNILLFDGDGPDAKFAGLSYVLNLVPEGFTGPYDSWHSHKSVCSQGATIMSLTEENSPVWLTEAECVARGWSVRPLANDQMMHLWIGPEYINGAAIFAHDHPLLFDGYNPRRDV